MAVTPEELGIETLLTIRETAQALRTCEETIRRWIIGGALEAVELPNRGKHRTFRVKQSTLDKVLKAGAR